MNRNMLVGRLKRLVQIMGELEDIADESWRFDDLYNTQVFFAYEEVRKRAGRLFERARIIRPHSRVIRELEYDCFEERCSMPLQIYDSGD
jgi:hypothetical protein